MSLPNNNLVGVAMGNNPSATLFCESLDCVYRIAQGEFCGEMRRLVHTVTAPLISLVLTATVAISGRKAEQIPVYVAGKCRIPIFANRYLIGGYKTDMVNLPCKPVAKK